MNTSDIKENDTFRFGESYHLNACVGKNGYVDFFQYQNGYRDATSILLESIRKPDFNPDSMVYPILYSARHAVELFLKNQIYQLYAVEEIVKGSVSQIRMNIHEIDELLAEYNRLVEYDARFKEDTELLNDFLKDYVDVDNNGEAFRYPFSNVGELHNTQLYCVNLGIFAEKFNELLKLMDNLDFLTEQILEEYQTGTVVKGVSRDIIEQISKQLPLRSDWDSSEFAEVKAKIREEYELSSRTFQAVLKLIENHYEFAANIGLEVSIPTLTPQELREYLDIFNEFELKKSESFMKHKHAATERIANTIRIEAIASIAALREYACQYRYCERFEQIRRYYEKSDPYDVVFNHLIGFERVHDRLGLSLRKLRQKTLLEELQKDNH